MARKLRIDEAGVTFHVWANGVNSLTIFRDVEDKNFAQQLLREEVENSDWSCFEYSIMGTHYHTVLRLAKPTLSSGFKRFNMRYAQYFNRRYRRRGHVFDARFHSKLLEGRFAYCEVMRYIARNAPDARICERAEQYPWCGYGSTIGLFDPDEIVDLNAVLQLFNSRAAYGAYIEEPDIRVRWGLTRARPALAQRPRRTGRIARR
jgi:hypothetical protein